MEVTRGKSTTQQTNAAALSALFSSQPSWIQASIQHLASTTRCATLILADSVTSDDNDTKCLFWTSRLAKKAYVLLLIAILLKRPFTLYGILILFLHKILAACALWVEFHCGDREVRRAVGNVRSFCRTVIQESEKAVEGDYARLVAAGYVLYNCTAPGESYLGYVIRYKMSHLNHQVIDEIQEWRERRLGYERAKSKRNLFA